MAEHELNPLLRLDTLTRQETDFGKYLKEMIRWGFSTLMKTGIPEGDPEAQEALLQMMVGSTTSRILDNRRAAGLPNTLGALYRDPTATEGLRELLPDPRHRMILSRGILDAMIGEDFLSK